jgi:hypothetical protein
MIESLAIFYGTRMLRGNKYSVEEDGSSYDSRLIIHNNPYIIFTIDGNGSLVEIQRITG